MPPTMPLLAENDQGTTSNVHQVMEESSHANSSPPNDETGPLIFTNLKLLHCPICGLLLTAPIFQCCNLRHIACSSCRIEIKNVCPSCSLPVGYIRSRVMEKTLESVKCLCKFLCKNMEYGCKAIISYDKIHEHELMCIHAPCSCPHLGCNFVASAKLLQTHYLSEHSDHSSQPTSMGENSIQKQPSSRPQRFRKLPKWLDDYEI